MKLVSLCAADWEYPVHAIVKSKPFTSPPIDAAEGGIRNVLELAAQADVFYLRLHGYKGNYNWYGQKDEDHGPAALTPDLVAEHNWSMTVILAEVCYGARSEMAQAFLANEARAFIGSKGPAYGRLRPTFFDGEADQLCKQFIKAYRRERDPHVAYALALGKFALLSVPIDSDDRATLRDFVILTREKDYED